MATINRLLVGLFISGALMAQNQLVINPITGMWDLVNNAASPSGGAIGGASAVAAGQVLFGTAPGVAGTNAEFTYNAANTELTITKAGGNWERIFLANTTALQGALIRFTNPTANVDMGIFGGANSGWMVFRQNAIIGMAMAPTTRNVVIGSATPIDDGTNRLQVAGSASISGDIVHNVNNASHGFFGGTSFISGGGFSASGPSLPGQPSSVFIYRNGTTLTARFTENGNQMLGVSGGTETNFRLDIGSSGSSGTLRAWNPAIGGATPVVSRAGDTQVGANRTTGQNSGGGAIAYVASDGGLGAVSYVVGTDYGANGVALLFKNSYVMQWSSTSSFAGSRDLVVDRQAAGVLRISNTGTTGGGLLIEGLKSTTGTRYVCVDTTGRFTSSATACSGT
jgi:hypothetical protein